MESPKINQRNSKNTLFKQNSQTLISGKTQAYWRQLYQSSSPHFEDNQYMSSQWQKLGMLNHKNQEAKSIIEKLINTKNISPLTKASPLNKLPRKKDYLAETQTKIFKEIIGLVFEVEEIKQKINFESQNIKQIQIQHPDIADQIKYYGYTQRLTKDQIADLQDENEQLILKIKTMTQQKVQSIEEILEFQKQKYNALKKSLAQNRFPSQVNDQEKIKIQQSNAKLRSLISQLQNKRKIKLNRYFPEIQRLKAQNQELRIKTIVNLKDKNQYQGPSSEESQLLSYLQSEEKNRKLFLEELKIFGQEYNRLKQQNQILEQKIQKRLKNNYKQNNQNYQNRSTFPITQKSLYIQSQINKRQNPTRDKFGEYQNLIQQMKGNRK